MISGSAKTYLSQVSLGEKAKRIALSFVLVVALSFGIVPAQAFADIQKSDIIVGTTVEASGVPASECPSIAAKYAYVIDSDGKEYFNRDADAQVNIASITKVMTAIVAMDYGDLDNTTITISQDAASIGESSAGLRTGDSMNLRTALECMMINSGNDAAQAIGECVGELVKSRWKEQGRTDIPDGGYVCFVQAMNEKAKELGMDESLFANPHGLDFDSHTADMHCSARDVYKMCACAMQNQTFRDIVCKDSDTIQVTRDGASADVELTSTDTLLGSYDAACGIKTGYTELAGECFAGAFTWNGKTVYCIVLDSNSETQRFSDAKTLFEWVTSHQIDYPLVHSTETVTYDLKGDSTTVPVVAYVANDALVNTTFKATLKDPNATVNICSLDGNVSQKAEFNTVGGDIHVGDKVGTLYFYQHNKLIAQQDIVAAEESKGPNPLETLMIFFGKTFQGQKAATSTLVNTTPIIYGAYANK